ETRRAFWDRVAFYNYVQGAVGKAARIRPSDELWEASRAPFEAAFARLAPDYVIVFGVTLAERLIAGRLASRTDSGGPVGELRSGSNRSKALFLPHPASKQFVAAELYEDRV